MQALQLMTTGILLYSPCLYPEKTLSCPLFVKYFDLFIITVDSIRTVVFHETCDISICLVTVA